MKEERFESAMPRLRDARHGPERVQPGAQHHPARDGQPWAECAPGPFAGARRLSGSKESSLPFYAEACGTFPGAQLSFGLALIAPTILPAVVPDARYECMSPVWVFVQSSATWMFERGTPAPAS